MIHPYIKGRKQRTQRKYTIHAGMSQGVCEWIFIIRTCFFFYPKGTLLMKDTAVLFKSALLYCLPLGGFSFLWNQLPSLLAASLSPSFCGAAFHCWMQMHWEKENHVEHVSL